MPLIQVTMVEGRSVDQKRELIRRLSDAAAQALDIPLDRVRIAIYEVDGESWGIAGETYAAVRGPAST